MLRRVAFLACGWLLAGAGGVCAGEVRPIGEMPGSVAGLTPIIPAAGPTTFSDVVVGDPLAGLTSSDLSPLSATQPPPFLAETPPLSGAAPIIFPVAALPGAGSLRTLSPGQKGNGKGGLPQVLEEAVRNIPADRRSGFISEVSSRLEQLFTGSHNGSAAKIPLETVDATDALLGLLDAVRAGQAPALSRRARDYRIILLGGLAYHLAPDYFDPNIQRLKALGLDVEFVRTDSLGRHEVNAPVIAASILRSDKPVMLFAHSKGGLDALDALQRFPSAQENVSHMVLIQAPYRGSALADHFLQNPWLYHSTVLFLRLFNFMRPDWAQGGIQVETLHELSRPRRAAAPWERPAIAEHIELYSVVSRAPVGTYRRLLWRLASWHHAISGMNSDGLVSPWEGIVPGSTWMLLDGVSHFDPVFAPTGPQHRALGMGGQSVEFAEQLTEALMHLVFSEPRRPR